MDRRIALVVVGLVATTPSGAVLAECQCRGNGTFYDQGEVACIRTNAGPKLARCEMALNIATWTIVGDGCPSAGRTPAHLIASAIVRPEMIERSKNGE